MDNFVCPACQSVVSSSRREAHETLWCPALEGEVADSGVRADEDAELAKTERESHAARMGSGGARALLSSLYAPEVTAEVSCLPEVQFTMEQLNIFAEVDTGGALWYADRALAEYLALSRIAGGALFDLGQCAGGGSTLSTGGVALVLGCGGVPFSGLIAGATGFDVVLTDLEIVLPQTRRNVQRNLEVLTKAANIAGAPRPPLVLVRELPFGDRGSLTSVLDEMEVGNDARTLLILCSDCIWKPELHVPLVTTIRDALRLGDPKTAAALVSFQTRNADVEKAFFSTLTAAVEGQPLFHIENVDIRDALQVVRWPIQIRNSLLQDGVDLQNHFKVYRLRLQLEPESL
eukprot:TRINITY_DN52319_c0_g1_i1.p1 TRINITY_DN52319_c0_g1~~TRINITY_DN52319_c0_g1_i1.p1  ORF type:complete len:347 (-),score=52.31 TRINITY_DN52319_c0_g1_i1:120-1160(-)